MSKARARDLQLQLAKSLLLEKDAPAQVSAPYKRDRMHLSQDILVARALREPATEVHKRNPRTTYLSQVESLVALIEEVTETQEAIQAKPQPNSKKKTSPQKNKWGNSKSGPVTVSGKGKLPVRKPALPKPRSLSAGAVR
jgi:hypothetical protein